MERPETADQNDIATERYKGPGALVTGAGEGAIAHYGTGIAGLVIGSVASFVGYKTVNRWEENLRNFHKNNVDSGNAVSRFSAKVLNKVSEWSHHAGQYLTKASFLKKVPVERMDAMIFGGGLLGVFGFFVAPLYFMITGAKHSNDGKVQFHRAQDEILTARAERDALRDKYVESQIELDTLRGRAGDTALAVAKDNPPAIDKTREETIAALDAAPLLDSPTEPTAPEIKPAKTTGRTLDSVQADSPTRPSEPTIGPAPNTGRTLPGEPPRIQEPVIGPENAPANKVEGAMLADRLATQAEAAQLDGARL